MTLQERKEEIIEEFSIFDEWLDKYQYIIDLAKNLPSLDDSVKTPENKIKGCQSNVWLNSWVEDGKIFFNADSDALITKGIISLLISVYSGRTADEIASDNFDFLETIGLRENLSPTRANGLVSMVETIKKTAQEWQKKC